MKLIERFDLLEKLRNYLVQDNTELHETIENAHYYNSWFTPEYIRLSINNIAQQFLNKGVLDAVAGQYGLRDSTPNPRRVGLVMAGNIPLVGFHDFLCIFLSGHYQSIKLSSKDSILMKHIVEILLRFQPAFQPYVQFAESLTGCDAYIATGSNNTSRYFQQYFAKYPHIIRKNRTAIAILDGMETAEELNALSDDIQLYFGLGCRNVSQIWVPEGYDFLPLLNALGKYDHYLENHKYKHNYDYVLTINMMNREQYFTNGSIVLSPNRSPFAGIANVNYAYYQKIDQVINELNPDDLQVILGHDFKPFGQAQCPGFFDYADGVDTMAFLMNIN